MRGLLASVLLLLLWWPVATHAQTIVLHAEGDSAERAIVATQLTTLLRAEGYTVTSEPAGRAPLIYAVTLDVLATHSATGALSGVAAAATIALWHPMLWGGRPLAGMCADETRSVMDLLLATGLSLPAPLLSSTLVIGPSVDGVTATLRDHITDVVRQTERKVAALMPRLQALGEQTEADQLWRNRGFEAWVGAAHDAREALERVQQENAALRARIGELERAQAKADPPRLERVPTLPASPTAGSLALPSAATTPPMPASP